MPDHPDLQIDEDPVFQERQAFVQRVGWVCMALLIAAGLAGLFGAGPAAKASVASSDERLAVDYERIVRTDAHTELIFTGSIDPAAPSVQLSLLDGYLQRVELREIVPIPIATRRSSERATFEFAPPKSGRDFRVVLRIVPREPGTLDGWAALGDGSQVSFTQIVLP